jgi:hypothetical protein
MRIEPFCLPQIDHQRFGFEVGTAKVDLIERRVDQVDPLDQRTEVTTPHVFLGSRSPCPVAKVTEHNPAMRPIIGKIGKNGRFDTEGFGANSVMSEYLTDDASGKHAAIRSAIEFPDRLVSEEAKGRELFIADQHIFN